MRDEILYRLKMMALLALFLAPVGVLQWSQRVQAQLEQENSSLAPAPEFALLQFAEDGDVN